MLSVAFLYYWCIALLVFAVWFQIFLKDSTTEKTDPASWVVLIVGTSFWPVVLPLAYLELYFV